MLLCGPITKNTDLIVAGIHERNFVKFENLCKYSKSAHSHTHSDGRTTTAHTVNSTQSAPLTSGHSGAPLTSRHSRTLNIHLNLHDKKKSESSQATLTLVQTV